MDGLRGVWGRLGWSPALTGFVCAVVAISFWSTNALAAKVALSDLGVVQVLALQFGGATAILLALRLAGVGVSGAGRGSWSSANILSGVFIGVTGLTGTIFLQYLAFATAPIVEANVLAYGWPLFAAIWAAFAYRSRQALAGVPLALVGFAGVAIILASGGDFGDGQGGLFGYVAAIISAVCMTFYTVMSGRYKLSVYTFLLPATVSGMALALALCVAGVSTWNSGGPEAWVASIYAGVGPMAGGFFLWSRAMSEDGIKRLAPLGYATPLASTLLLLLAGERFGAWAFVGAALVLICSIGVLVADKITHEK